MHTKYGMEFIRSFVANGRDALCFRYVYFTNKKIKYILIMEKVCDKLESTALISSLDIITTVYYFFV